MKKIIFLLLLLIIIPMNISAATEFGSYTDAQQMIKEAMKSYYLRGSNVQYNYSRATYGSASPEEMTKQDGGYLVCAAFTYSTYVEAFGMKYEKGVSEFPRYNYNISDYAAKYYKDNKDDASKLDGNYLIYYENDSESIKYVYNNATSFDAFVNLIKPGDLFVYTGHALIAYDVVTNPDTGKKDVLILNSTQTPYIPTRIDGTSKISYNIFPSSHSITNTLNIPQEGTIQGTFLSEISSFGSGTVDCKKEECAVLRPFYNKNGKAMFNYKINESQYNNTKFRTEYPGMYVEKFVNKGDNNSVYIGDELIYTIKITNKSNVDGQNVTYKKFYVEETLDDSVEYIESNGYSTQSGNIVKWPINSLAVGETVELIYKVRVKNNLENINTTIESKGKIREVSEAYITTGTTKNKIIPKVTSPTKTYEECYNEIGNYGGLAMLDVVYECMYPEETFNFSSFSFTNIFDKNTSLTIKEAKPAGSLIVPKDPNNKFYKMILNNYWSGLVKTTDNKYSFPFWKGDYTKDRAKNINPIDFKDGDILIYEEDNLIYAYIFINGKFIRKNVSGQSRAEFTYTHYSSDYSKLYAAYNKLTASNTAEVLTHANYQTLYDKDYYVILRPELLIKEIASIEVDRSTLSKITYKQNEKELDMSGVLLNVNYNNGSIEKKSMENSNITISGFDTSEIGTNTLTIEFEGFSTTLDIQVVDQTPPTPEPNPEPTPKPQDPIIPPETGVTISVGLLVLVTIITTIFYKKYVQKQNKSI